MSRLQTSLRLVIPGVVQAGLDHRPHVVSFLIAVDWGSWHIVPGLDVGLLLAHLEEERKALPFSLSPWLVKSAGQSHSGQLQSVREIISCVYAGRCQSQTRAESLLYIYDFGLDI